MKIFPIIEPGHDVNATEEDGTFTDTYIGYRKKVWDPISQLLHVTDAWPNVKITRNNCDGRKAVLAFYDHFLGPNNVDHP